MDIYTYTVKQPDRSCSACNKCMYSHIYACMDIHIYTHLKHIRMFPSACRHYIWPYVCTHAWGYKHMHIPDRLQNASRKLRYVIIYVCIHTYMHACISTYIHTHIHAYIHMYNIYIHMYNTHTYIHMYIHTYIPRRPGHESGNRPVRDPKRSWGVPDRAVSDRFATLSDARHIHPDGGLKQQQKSLVCKWLYKQLKQQPKILVISNVIRN